VNVTIVGAGAIGLLTSVYLEERDHTVHLVTRTSDQSDFIELHGVTCIKKDSRITKSIRATCFESYYPINQDIIIVTTKQTHLVVFLEWAQQRVDPDVPILFLQNGMAHIEQVKEGLANPVFFGVVTHGAVKNSLNEVEHTGMGYLLVGGVRDQLKLLSPLWSKDIRFSINWSESMEVEMKKKLLINVVINPLTAIHQVKNGMLLINEKLKTEAYEVFEEARKILGFSEEMWADVVNVIRLTGENESSMNVDIQRGRKTEIDGITGYLLTKAKDNKCPARKIQHIHSEIKRLERKGEDA